MRQIFQPLMAVLLLAGCSTMFEGPTQKITIETPGAEGAQCVLRTDRIMYKVYPPRTFYITKDEGPWTVNCMAPGNRTKSLMFQPEIAASVFGNVVNGIGPGVLLDHSSRSMYKLPELVSIDFTGIKAQPQPLPAYQTLFKENPELVGMEEFRPGLPELQRDLGRMPPELQRRESGSDLWEENADLYEAPIPDLQMEVTAPLSSPVVPRPVSPDAESLTKEMNPKVFTSGSGTDESGDSK